MIEPPVEELQDAFARIEREVRAGNTDLKALGFWKLVRQVKLDPRLAAHWADVVGRIDRLAFESHFRFRLPVWLGNAILLTVTGAMIAAVWFAFTLTDIPLFCSDIPDVECLISVNPGPAGMLLLIAGGGLSTSLHCLAHWVVGRMRGIRFTSYFVKPPLMTPGLKTDYATYLRATPQARAAMHMAGAIVSKIAPFAVFTVAYLAQRASGYTRFPSWSLWALLGLGVLQIVTDVLFSTKKSDWKKVKRERGIARAQRVPRMRGS